MQGYSQVPSVDYFDTRYPTVPCATRQTLYLMTFSGSILFGLKHHFNPTMSIKIKRRLLWRASPSPEDWEFVQVSISKVAQIWFGIVLPYRARNARNAVGHLERRGSSGFASMCICEIEILTKSHQSDEISQDFWANSGKTRAQLAYQAVECMYISKLTKSLADPYTPY